MLIILFSFFSFHSEKSTATHIVGGEMYYEYLGSNDYKITLVVYRDCFNGIPWFDNPAFVSVFDSSYNRIKDISILPPGSDTIPLENYDSCTWVDTVCYEVAKYQFTANLPPIPGGYILAYDRCCWNASVLNIVLPLERGLTVLTTIPDSALAYGNSSPVFSNRTPPFFCVGKLFEFDHSAVDPDGDSLAYEIFTPYNSSRMWDSHKAPLVGPYSPLVYATGYSLSNVLGSTVPLTIDPVSGYLSARLDNQVGQFVFGVRVKEYRNGELIGSTDRNYQINSQPCQRYTVASFTKPIIKCGDSIVTFDNNSDSAKAYLWHFGDKNSNDSISISSVPTHKFSGMGKYTVSLVAYSHQGNSCNDTTYGSVSLYPDIEGEFIYEDEPCNNFVQFTDVTNLPVGQEVVQWDWTFGDGTGANAQNPYHQYNLGSEPRSFIVTLKIKNINGCTDSVMMLYTGSNREYKINGVSATKYIVYPRDDSTLLIDDADSAVLYTWSPTEGLSTPNKSSTFASPSERTLYTVKVEDNRGCVDYKTIDIDVHEYSCGENVVYVPNAFSPNGDGENDYMRIRGEEITFLRLSIFNRWGQLVFESENINMTKNETLGWDGSYQGVKQEPGVYVYQLEVQCSDNRVFTKKGNITLIR